MKRKMLFKSRSRFAQNEISPNEYKWLDYRQAASTLPQRSDEYSIYDIEMNTFDYNIEAFSHLC